MVAQERNFRSARLILVIAALAVVAACGPRSRSKDGKITPLDTVTKSNTGGGEVAGVAALDQNQLLISNEDRKALSKIADEILLSEGLQRSDALAVENPSVSLRRQMQNGKKLLMTVATAKGADQKVEVNLDDKLSARLELPTTGLSARVRCADSTCSGVIVILTKKDSKEAAVLIHKILQAEVSVTDNDDKKGSESEKGDLKSVLDLFSEKDDSKKLKAKLHVSEISFLKSPIKSIVEGELTKPDFSEAIVFSGPLGTLTDKNLIQALSISPNKKGNLAKVTGAYIVAPVPGQGSIRVSMVLNNTKLGLLFRSAGSVVETEPAKNVKSDKDQTKEVAPKTSDAATNEAPQTEPPQKNTEVTKPAPELVERSVNKIKSEQAELEKTAKALLGSDSKPTELGTLVKSVKASQVEVERSGKKFVGAKELLDKRTQEVNELTSQISSLEGDKKAEALKTLEAKKAVLEAAKKNLENVQRSVDFTNANLTKAQNALKSNSKFSEYQTVQNKLADLNSELSEAE